MVEFWCAGNANDTFQNILMIIKFVTFFIGQNPGMNFIYIVIKYKIRESSSHGYNIGITLVII